MAHSNASSTSDDQAVGFDGLRTKQRTFLSYLDGYLERIADPAAAQVRDRLREVFPSVFPESSDVL